MLKNYKKLTACALSVAMLLSPTCSYAAPPSPKSDEALYINLDAYGLPRETSIVKSYSLNDATTLTDYGQYHQVINMTDETKPTIGKDGSVSFSFPQNTPSRFYFEGKMKAVPTALPWTLDVGYKLNGVEIAAEKLAGTKGLIEINIHIIPNKSACDYYKNNMVLEVAAAVDADKILSVEAPGSQMQSLGSKKAILFFGLPGEERTFTLRIGSNDFSFGGLMVMMEPATLSQLSEIKNLREAKKTIEDSANAMNQSMDVILNTLSGMSGSLNATSKGLQELNDARGIISQGKSSVYADTDLALNELKGLSETLSLFPGHIEEAKATLKEVNGQLNTLNEHLRGASKKLPTLINDLSSLKSSTKKLQKVTENLRPLSKIKPISSTQLTDLAKLYSGLEAAGKTPQEITAYLESIGQHEAAMLYPAYRNGQLTLQIGTIASLNDLLSQANTMIGDVNSTINDLRPVLSDVTIDVSDLCDILATLVDKGDDALTDFENLQDLFSKRESEAEKALSDGKTLVEHASTGITGASKALQSLENLLKNSGTKLDSGTQKTLNGLVSTLEQSVKGLSQTEVLRTAKNTVKNTMDHQWEKCTGENSNLLNIDPSAAPISFTSGKNPAPQSIQVIMRTAEIVQEDGKEPPDVEESFHASGNIFTRILSIFKQLFQTIKNFFLK